jgi:hypothetical protein
MILGITLPPGFLAAFQIKRLFTPSLAGQAIETQDAPSAPIVVQYGFS